MAINKIDLTVTQIINDLNEGLTWLKKDDLGYGSIESKYGANEKQIATIRKHPALKDAETSITIFNIIDDREEVKQSTTESHSDQVIQMMNEQAAEEELNQVANEDAADVFANL